ncbi:hypothetical protein ACFLY4_10340, partial [Chloroflexota bacterium]
DALLFLDAPPVVLDDVQALRKADLLAFQILHLVDFVAGARQHATAFVDMGRPNQSGAADVSLDVDGRVAAAIAHQVVQVVDEVRIPVIFDGGTKVSVCDPNLLELFFHPTDLLIDVAGGHQRTVGVVELVPIYIDGTHCLAFDYHGTHSLLLLFFYCPPPDRR